MATTDFPSDPGIWVWDATSCLWTRTTGIPFPTGVTGVYGWDGGGQRWVLVDGTGGNGSGGTNMGVIDGSNAAPGQVGEYLSAMASYITGTSVTFSTRTTDPLADGDFSSMGTLTLPAGDWTVGAGIGLWLNAPGTVTETQVYLGPLTPNWSNTNSLSAWYIDQGDYSGNNRDRGTSIGPIRVSASASTLVGLQTAIIASTVVSAGCDYLLWARRER